MLTYAKIFFIAIVCIAFTACDNWVDPNIPVSTPFSVSFEGGNTIDAAGGTLNVTITAGTNGWWIEIPSESTWCTVDRMLGSGDRVLVVRATVNETDADRQVVITINPTFNLPPQTITIMQGK